MINVTLSQLLLVCLSIGLVLVFFSWLFGSSRVRRAEKRRMKGVVTCRICGVRYEGEGEDGSTTTCPACATPNEMEPPGMI